MSANLRLSWIGDHESLKEFVRDNLILQGTWSSPAGEKKLFESEGLTILWLKNKKFLAVNGKDAKEIRSRLIKAMCTSSDFAGVNTSVDRATNTENFVHHNISINHGEVMLHDLPPSAGQAQSSVQIDSTVPMETFKTEQVINSETVRSLAESVERLASIVAEIQTNVKSEAQDPCGQQIAIHAHGERACDQVLTAYEKILLNDPGSDRRHRMEHLGLMTEEQIERASRLKLGLSFNVNILYFYATAFSNFIVGPERTNRWAPSHLASKYGINWTLHQDHPSHPGPISPFTSMQTAVTRAEVGKPNKVYGPEYRVSIHEALKAYTINAAWQLHANDDLGILDKGKFADLLILGKNPYSCADHPEDLGKIPVVGTFVGGQPNDGLLKFVKNTDGTEKFYIFEHIEICPV